MGASEVLRAWLSLGVGFHEETAEIGNQFVDLVYLIFPPFHDLGVERVGSLQSAHLDRRGEVDGEIDADAVGPQLVGDGLSLLQTGGRECLRFGVHIVEHGAIDAHRGIGTGVHLHAFRVGIQEDAMSGKAALDGTVGVVPMVQDAQVVERFLLDVKIFTITVVCTRLPRMFQSQQVVGAVEQAGIGRCRNCNLAIMIFDGIAVAGYALLLLQHDRIALPVGLQLGHSRTFYACDRGWFTHCVEAEPQTAAVLAISGAPSGHQQNEH